MTPEVKPIPDGFNSISAYLIVKDAVEAMERSTRITRGLLARRNLPPGEDETDLAQRLRDLVALLGETLGGGHPLTLALPDASLEDSWLAARINPADFDLALMTLLQYAADTSGAQARLDLTLERVGDDARIAATVTSEGLPEGVVQAVTQPDLSRDPVTRTCLEAARELVRSAGGSLHAEPTSPDTWAFALVLPTV